MIMKKRKVKKKPFVILLLLILISIVGISYIKNKDTKQTDKKTTKTEKTNKTVNEVNKSMSLVSVGDVLIHEAVYKDALNKDGTYNFDKMFTSIGPLLKQYDLKYCNQESIIGGKSLGVSGYPNFNSPEEIGDSITKLGFNLIGLANNHAYDKGEKAILSSNDYWSKKDVITSGTYSNSSDRDNIPVHEKNGIKYVFLAYTTGINGNRLPDGKDYLINVYDENKVKEDINKIKDKVDVIMVAMHWGDEYTNEPTNSQKEIANYLASLGVNLIIGTHPHVVQPIEYINDTLVVYSLGNFISNQLVIGVNPAIGLMLGIDIYLDNGVKFKIKEKELLYSYSDNSTNFKVIPFSEMNDNILKDYKSVEKQYLDIVGGVE